MAEINSKVDCSYTELRCKYEDLTSKIIYMESQASFNTSSKYTWIHLGKAIQNPKNMHTQLHFRVAGNCSITRPQKRSLRTVKFKKRRISTTTKFKLMNQLNLISLQPHSTLYSIEQNQLLRKKKLRLQKRIKDMLRHPTNQLCLSQEDS